MLYCSYRISDGQFLRCWPNPPPIDEATEGIQTYPEHLRPNTRTERHDGQAPTKKRAATVQELQQYDTDIMTEQTATRFDGDKMLKALAIWTAQKLGIPLATARQEILTIYRGLP